MTRDAAATPLVEALGGWAPGPVHTARRTGADLDLAVGVAGSGRCLTATATLERP